jgi:hypothetical protein
MDNDGEQVLEKVVEMKPQHVLKTGQVKLKKEGW